MNLNQRWILPEGIEEALPEQADWLESARRTLIDLYRSWGYDLVMPPFIEYLDSLLTGSGRDLDLQTFKITDQLSGKMMGIRADMTPQVARIDANRLQSEQPNRLCYLGTVLTTRPKGFGGSRSPLQVGAELYGHAGFASDREILRLMMHTLEACGIQDLYLDLGHADIYRLVAARAGLSPEVTDMLFEMLQRKANPEIIELLATQTLDDNVREGLTQLAMLTGDESVLDKAEGLLEFAGESVLLKLQMLRKLGKTITEEFPQVTVNYDLAELRGYHYETGVVYSVYVPSEGKEIARGGRYDGIGSSFGRARPAVGFSTDLKMLRRLSDRTFPSDSRVIRAIDNDEEDYRQYVQQLRDAGDRVVYVLDGQQDDADSGFTHRITKQDGQWAVKEIG